jgi:hypothetical protein
VVTVSDAAPAVIVVRYQPWLERVVGSMFVVAGTWVMFAGELIFGGAFAVAGAAVLLLVANTVTSRFDRGTGRFTRLTKGLVRHTEVSHPLDDIATVGVQSGNGTADSPSKSYSVVVVLKSRERVPVPSATGGGKADKERLAAEIRAFVNISEVPQDPPGFGEMIGGMFDAARAAKSRQKR